MTFEYCLFKGKAPRVFGINTFIYLLALLFLPAALGAEDADLRISLERLNSSPYIHGVRVHALSSVKKFYITQGYHTTWTPEMLDELRTAVLDAKTHGLLPSDYHLEQLEQSGLDTALRDLFATDGYLTLAQHLHDGKLDPVSVEPDWTLSRDKVDYLDHLTQAIASHSIRDSLRELTTKQEAYQRLRDALALYQSIADQDGWPYVESGPLLRPGQRDDRITQLRARLEASRELEEIAQDRDIYDEALAQAVRGFQSRCNLEPDGIVGPATIRQLNLTTDDRINQLRVNLERWRWLPNSLGERHIRVNIADYRLDAFEKGQIAQQHEVIVGKTYRKTPIFSDVMRYLVFNPSWTVPAKLARQDKLPQFQKDPNLVKTLGFQILNRDGLVIDADTIDWNALSAANLPYTFRQLPGESNALGRVKFMFPNKFDVYLHDTSSRELFSKTRRDFSSGCIRVKDPIELSRWLLAQNSDWSPEREREVLNHHRETRVNLASPVDVHLLYWTAVYDRELDAVRFLEDIYERDANILFGLNAADTGDRHAQTVDTGQ